MVSLALAAGALCALACWCLGAALAAVSVVRAGTALRVGLPGGALCGVALAVALGFDADAGLVAAVPLCLFASLAVVRALDGVRGEWGRRLRSRFLFGVPWGTLLTVAGVAAFYLFVQGGWTHPNAPVSLPFTSWSYLYPLGVLTAPFAHAGLAHVTGNLIGALVYAPIAEYAWSHYPETRGASSFGSLRANPYVRAFVVFPLAAVLVGVITSALAWGPIIGFSGVVFAFGAFALTRYPLAVVAAVAAEGFVSTAYHALRNPVVVASAGPSYGGPWWAGIAVQGHATGVFVGVLLGALLVAYRNARPSAARLWFAAVTYAASVPLYLLWWYRGPSTYVLYRGLGVLFVVALGLFVAAGVRAGPRALAERLSIDVPRHRIAAVCLVFPLVVTAFVAVPVNLTTVAAGPPANAAHAVHVRDYTVTYDEHVPNRRVGAISISVLNESTNVNASGVIVSSRRRHLWTQAASTGHLAYAGTVAVRVGGVGWRHTVYARRRGWTPVGNDTVYRVSLDAGSGWQYAYASPNTTAAPTVAGRNVSLSAGPDGFAVSVHSGNRTQTASLPGENATLSLGGLRLTHRGDRLLAARNGTRVTVATAEHYH